MKKQILLLGILWTSTAALAAITSQFSGSELTISTDEGDDIVLTVENGFVKLNGLDPDSGPLEANLVRDIDVNGDDGDNEFDFSAVTATDFPIFFAAEFDTRGGNDVLAATDFRDVIDLGEGIDQITFFGAGFNLLDWERGAGNESFTFNEPEGTLRIRFQGSTSDDNIQISAMGNVASLTDLTSSETIQVENITDFGLQLRNGNDIVNVNDLSSLTTREPIFINKDGDSINYLGENSNYPVVLNANLPSLNVDALATPGQGSTFSRSTSFGSTPFDFDITKTGNTVRVFEQDSNSTSNLEGFNVINLAGTQSADTFNLLEDVGSADLETIRFNGVAASDEYNVVFQTSTDIIIGETSGNDGEDTLNLDAQGNLVTEDGSFLESLEPFGRIEATNVEVINITKEAETVRWIIRGEEN